VTATPRPTGGEAGGGRYAETKPLGMGEEALAAVSATARHTDGGSLSAEAGHPWLSSLPEKPDPGNHPRDAWRRRIWSNSIARRRPPRSGR
jgi:hypothetical protein